MKRFALFLFCKKAASGRETALHLQIRQIVPEPLFQKQGDQRRKKGSKKSQQEQPSEYDCPDDKDPEDRFVVVCLFLRRGGKLLKSGRLWRRSTALAAESAGYFLTAVWTYHKKFPLSMKFAGIGRIP